MKETLLVLRQEILSSLRRRSFQLTAFGFPLISASIFIVASFFTRSSPDTVSDILNPVQSREEKPIGFVDQGGLIRTLPENLPEHKLPSYKDEAMAQEALSLEEIQAYYVIPGDYLETGRVDYVSGEFNPLDTFTKGSLINEVLRINLLEGDIHLANLISRPFLLQVMIQNPSTNLGDGNPLSFFLPYSVMLLYYILILMSAGFLVTSLNKERENRVLEIMLMTITSRQLLAGKFIGLGLIGLLVNLLWVGTGYALLIISGNTFQLPEEYQLGSHILLWGGVYFLLGYAVYASLMGAVGAMLPNLRETSQATIVVIIPMIFPLLFISVLIENPNGLLAVGLSIFPLTSPVTMMLRLTVGDVPLWQLMLSVFVLLLSAVIIVIVVARLFRAQTVLEGQPMSLRKVYRMILGKV
jgi:ABC-2 type transport system permease protein